MHNEINQGRTTMRKFFFITATAVLLLATQASSFAQGMLPEGVKANGTILTDAKGMTLYTYDNDKEPGKSSCVAQCLANWPAVAAAASAKPMGSWTIIIRDDGSKQLAYKGKPLYTFAHDAKPGDVTGDGRGKIWHTATL
jgi:predicted lipoprotein with Yx(FWY)xxD motif